MDRRPSLGPEPDHDADPGATPGADLAWEAFRYVADAMSPLEVAAFEHRLLADQSAREAVAAAVDQLGAVAIVSRELAATSPAAVPFLARVGRRGRAGLVALVAAASVLLAAWWGSTARRGPDPMDLSADLARAWADLRQGSTAPEGTLPFLPDFGGVGSDPALADAAVPEIVEVPADQPLPSWMMAAVAPDPNLEDH